MGSGGKAAGAMAMPLRTGMWRRSEAEWRVDVSGHANGGRVAPVKSERIKRIVERVGWIVIDADVSRWTIAACLVTVDGVKPEPEIVEHGHDHEGGLVGEHG